MVIASKMLGPGGRNPTAATVRSNRFEVELMIHSTHTHPKDCPDHALAARDRNRRAQMLKEREAAHQLLARAEWLTWYPPHKAK